MSARSASGASFIHVQPANSLEVRMPVSGSSSTWGPATGFSSICPTPQPASPAGHLEAHDILRGRVGAPGPADRHAGPVLQAELILHQERVGGGLRLSHCTDAKAPGDVLFGRE
jgi:hypothetical protein